MLIHSQEGAGVGSTLLYVVDEEFESAANLLSLRPDVVRFSPDTPLARMRLFNVSWTERVSLKDDNVIAIEMADKIILIDRAPARWKWIMTLGGPQFQRTIIGYYNDDRSRQMVWIP